MLEPKSFALFFTVALLAITLYFLLGSVPLLVLKHDDPMDATFIRKFYLTYYRFALVAAIAATLSYALAARPVFALGAGAIATLTWVLRSRFIPTMDNLGQQIQADAHAAIPAFRRIHKSAIAINATQLVAMIGSLAWF